MLFFDLLLNRIYQNIHSDRLARDLYVVNVQRDVVIHVLNMFYVTTLMRDQYHNILVIAWCVVSQLLNRKITDMILRHTLHLK